MEWGKNMTKEEVYEFISKQKTSLISSVDENGYPATRALIAPRLIENNDIYFSTYVSSNKVKHYLNNPKACVYFYEKGKNYQGVMIKGLMEICTDQETKDKFWRHSDYMFFRNGPTDSNYCVLKFTGFEAQFFSRFKIQTIKL